MYNWCVDYNKRDKRWGDEYKKEVLKFVDNHYDDGEAKVTYGKDFDIIAVPEGDWNIYYNASGNINCIIFTSSKRRMVFVYEIY